MHRSSHTAFEGQYVSGKEIGKGTFSVVREAIDRETGAVRAAKWILLSDGGYNPEEAEILTSIEHECIVRAHSVFFTATHCVIVTDLVKGGELYQLAARRSIPEEIAARYMQELLSALTYIHERGIVHRDVKLENILVREDGHAQLIDFGFSKRIGDKRVLNSCCGSPNYMAPEMLRATRTQDQAVLPTKHSKYGREVDMWAAGVVMYVLLFGKYPFFDERRSVWHKSILMGQYVVPSSSCVSPAAQHLLARLLCVHSEQRITAQDALEHEWIRGAASSQAFAQQCVTTASSACSSASASAEKSTPLRRKSPPHAVAAAAAVTVAFTPPHNTHKLAFESPQ